VDPLVDAERLVYRRTYCRHMAGLLRQAIAAGELPDQDVEFSATALIGAISESLVGPLSPAAGRIASEEDLVARLLRFCRRSLGAPARSEPAPSGRRESTDRPRSRDGVTRDRRSASSTTSGSVEARHGAPR